MSITCMQRTKSEAPTVFRVRPAALQGHWDCLSQTGHMPASQAFCFLVPFHDIFSKLISKTNLQAGGQSPHGVDGARDCQSHGILLRLREKKVTVNKLQHKL
jgi:hypothetical protein